jgi:hypothetical protein
MLHRHVMMSSERWRWASFVRFALDISAMQRDLPGTWQLSAARSHNCWLRLDPNGGMQLHTRARESGDRWLELLAGEVAAGDWDVWSELPASRQSGSITRSASDIAGSFTGSLAPARALLDASQRQPTDAGPFLRLHINRLPNSLLNVRIAGFQLNLADVVIAVAEMKTDYFIKVDSWEPGRLAVRINSNPEAWTKVAS